MNRVVNVKVNVVNFHKTITTMQMMDLFKALIVIVVVTVLIGLGSAAIWG